MKHLYICPYKDKCNERGDDCPHKVPHEKLETCDVMSCNYYDGKMTEICQPYTEMNRNGANK